MRQDLFNVLFCAVLAALVLYLGLERRDRTANHRRIAELERQAAAGSPTTVYPGAAVRPRTRAQERAVLLARIGRLPGRSRRR